MAYIANDETESITVEGGNMLTLSQVSGGAPKIFFPGVEGQLYTVVIVGKFLFINQSMNK